MKFLKVIVFVMVGHVLLIGALMLQPGCNAIDQQWAEYRLEQQRVNVPNEVLAQEQGLPPDSEEVVDPSLNAGLGVSPNRVRSTPTRPPETAAPAPAGLETEPSEPLFNPGISGGINAPMEPSSPTSGYVPYTVQRGDTLWGLSKEYSVPFATLLEANGMTRDTQLSVGQEILVPSGYDELGIVADTQTEMVAAEGTSIYTVGRGDTLSEIAARSGTSVSRIKSLNNMGSDTIRVGQKLIVPGEIAVVEEETIIETVDFNPSDYTAVHVVDSGETPSGIALRYGMTTTELLAVNGISDARLLRAGSELKVKPAAVGSKSSGGGSAAAAILPPREEDPAGMGGIEEINNPVDEPVAPAIVPREVTPVEPDADLDEEGFGAEIFEDFEGIEEVPVDRRSSDEG